MEYRLSKSSGLDKQGLGISNLLVTPAAPQFPFNPFTMPLAAVKAHIALLQQEQKYLQAQSDAFDGSSSSATTASASSTKLSISKVQWVAQATDSATNMAATALTTPAADSNVQVYFATTDDIPASARMYVYYELMTSSSDTTNIAMMAGAGNVAAGSATAWSPIVTTTGSDGAVKYADGTTAVSYALTATATAATAGGVRSFITTSVASGSSCTTLLDAGFVGTSTIAPSTTNLAWDSAFCAGLEFFNAAQKIPTNAAMMVGLDMSANVAVTNNAVLKVTMKIMDGTTTWATATANSGVY